VTTVESVGSHIKRRIAQNIRHASSSSLRKMSGYFGGNGRFYRRQFLQGLGISWSAGIEDYVKQCLLRVFGDHVTPAELTRRRRQAQEAD
jgi:hypothetical protein